MKTVFLHGLGQTAHEWDAVLSPASLPDADCPELSMLTEGELSYTGLRTGFEKRYADVKEAFRICGLSLGAVLALDYAIHHKEKVDSLILIGAQYKTPALLIDFQNLIFRCMPEKAFSDMGVSKQDMIRLCHSMRSLDFTSGLREVSCPVKILCGEKDRANLKASRQLCKLLPQAELHIVPGAGHEINKCAPEAIAAILNC